MPEDKYLSSEMSVDADRERLSPLEQTYDPASIRHLEMLGVTSGWKCLDVGAGFGSITTWLSERVAPDGKVVATDIRPELHRQSADIIEIREHDILKDELEKDYYDLVHCRSLLQHLSKPDTALSKMADAVKPGGWLLIEEFDNFTTPSFDTRNESADSFYKSVHRLGQIAVKGGISVDFEFGRKTLPLIERLGFTETGGEGTMPFSQGGDPWAKSVYASNKAGIELFADLFSQEDIKEMKELHEKTGVYLEDPSFHFISMPLFSAWGRKPI
ncbi:MAG: class I SAM-dependent methyltransferase [Dehalococcoidales bacterium]|nr:MAG: class I SAM-dependent methyltransferase [Dehalococcoidales bacterium]